MTRQTTTDTDETRKCAGCRERHSDFDVGEKHRAGPGFRGWVRPIKCLRCGFTDEETGL